MSQAIQPRVAILTTTHIALFELGCAVELFALPRPEFEHWYQTDVVRFSDEPQKATGGIGISTTKVDNLKRYDMLVIPSWPIDQKVSSRISRAVLSLHKRGGKIISFCSGAFLLGEIGLLDGKKATTHWRYAEQFKKRFIQTLYVDDVLYLYQDAIGCSAGSSAAIDLGIEVIRDDFGYIVANQVARRLVLAAHRSGGQSQYVEFPVARDAACFSATLDWALNNIANSIDIETLASKANMTRRTFDRQFRRTLDMSPKEWLISQRLIRAKSLLEMTTQNIDMIAYNSGFETAMTLRHNFRKYLKTSPSRHRKDFSGF